MPNQLSGQRTVLTGASSGIGLAIAKRLAAAEADVIAFGRRPADALTEKVPGRRYISRDLAQPGAAAVVVEAVEDAGWHAVDLLILNAAMGNYRTAGEETAGSIDTAVTTNLLAPIEITHRLADRLASAGGRVVLVGSSAHRGATGFPVYAATKGALAGFARALRSEWQGRIVVQIIHPGPTATPMHTRAGFDPGNAALFFLSADRVAAMILDAIRTNRSPRSASYLASIWRRG